MAARPFLAALGKLYPDSSDRSIFKRTLQVLAESFHSASRLTKARFPSVQRQLVPTKPMRYFDYQLSCENLRLLPTVRLRRFTRRRSARPHFCFFLLMAAGLGMYPLGLDAGTATFNDLSTFTSSIGSGSFTQTFDCFGAGAVPSPLSISGGGYSISASDDSRTFFNVGPAPDVWLSTSSSDL